jgi:hypothetical protein
MPTREKDRIDANCCLNVAIGLMRYRSEETEGALVSALRGGTEMPYREPGASVCPKVP